MQVCESGPVRVALSSVAWVKSVPVRFALDRSPWTGRLGQVGLAKSIPAVAFVPPLTPAPSAGRRNPSGPVRAADSATLPGLLALKLGLPTTPGDPQTPSSRLERDRPPT